MKNEFSREHESILEAFYASDQERRDGEGELARGAEAVLWRVILEVRCAGCQTQDRWRGKSESSVLRFARSLGWMVWGRKARCPTCMASLRKGKKSSRKWAVVTCCVICGGPLAPYDGKGAPPRRCTRHTLGKKKGRDSSDLSRVRKSVFRPLVVREGGRHTTRD